MLSADGYLSHHLPPSVTMRIPVRKYVDVVIACVPPTEPDRVHPVMGKIPNTEELVDVALVFPDLVPTRWRELHRITQNPRLPDDFRQSKRCVRIGFNYHCFGAVADVARAFAACVAADC